MSLIVNIFGSYSDWIKAVIDKHRKWKKMSEPVTSSIIDCSIDLEEGQNENNLESSMRDWLVLKKYTGFFSVSRRSNVSTLGLASFFAMKNLKEVMVLQKLSYLKTSSCLAFEINRLIIYFNYEDNFYNR